MFRKKLILALLVLALVSTTKNVTAKGKMNDFPTEARAEYIFACMHSNELSPTFLKKCSLQTILHHLLMKFLLIL